MVKVFLVIASLLGPAVLNASDDFNILNEKSLADLLALPQNPDFPDLFKNDGNNPSIIQNALDWKPSLEELINWKLINFNRNLSKTPTPPQDVETIDMDFVQTPEEYMEGHALENNAIDNHAIDNNAIENNAIDNHSEPHRRTWAHRQWEDANKKSQSEEIVRNPNAHIPRHTSTKDIPKLTNHPDVYYEANKVNAKKSDAIQTKKNEFISLANPIDNKKQNNIAANSTQDELVKEPTLDLEDEDIFDQINTPYDEEIEDMIRQKNFYKETMHDNIDVLGQGNNAIPNDNHMAYTHNNNNNVMENNNTMPNIYMNTNQSDKEDDLDNIENIQDINDDLNEIVYTSKRDDNEDDSCEIKTNSLGETNVRDLPLKCVVKHATQDLSREELQRLINEMKSAKEKLSITTQRLNADSLAKASATLDKLRHRLEKIRNNETNKDDSMDLFIDSIEARMTDALNLRHEIIRASNVRNEHYGLDLPQQSYPYAVPLLNITPTHAKVSNSWWDNMQFDFSRNEMHQRVCSLFSQYAPESSQEIIQALEATKSIPSFIPENTYMEHIYNNVFDILTLSLGVGDFTYRPKSWSRFVKQQIITNTKLADPNSMNSEIFEEVAIRRLEEWPSQYTAKGTLQHIPQFNIGIKKSQDAFDVFWFIQPLENNWIHERQAIEPAFHRILKNVADAYKTVSNIAPKNDLQGMNGENSMDKNESEFILSALTSSEAAERLAQFISQDVELQNAVEYLLALLKDGGNAYREHMVLNNPDNVNLIKELQNPEDSSVIHFLPPRDKQYATAILEQMRESQRDTSAIVLSSLSKEQQAQIYMFTQLYPNQVRSTSDIFKILRKIEALGWTLSKETPIADDASADENDTPPTAFKNLALKKLALYGELTIRNSSGDIILGPVEMLCPHMMVPRYLLKGKPTIHETMKYSSKTYETMQNSQSYSSFTPQNSSSFAMSQYTANQDMGYLPESIMFEVQYKSVNREILADEDLRPIVSKSFALLQPNDEIPSRYKLHDVKQYEIQGANGAIHPDCKDINYMLIAPIEDLSLANINFEASENGYVVSDEVAYALMYTAQVIAESLQVPWSRVAICAVREPFIVGFSVMESKFNDPILGAAAWRGALTDPQSPINKAFRINLNQTPAIVKGLRESTQGVLDELFSSKFDSPYNIYDREDTINVHFAMTFSNMPPWLWALFIAGLIMLIFVGSITLYLTVKYIKQRRSNEDGKDDKTSNEQNASHTPTQLQHQGLSIYDSTHPVQLSTRTE